MNDIVDLSLSAISKLRTQRPWVHCITNNVAQHFTANVLLACGAVPSMTVAPEEIEDFVSKADSVLINLGTMDLSRTWAANKAAEIAAERSKPFVLDPVFVQASEVRLDLARELLEKKPAIVRANLGEGEALFGDGFLNGGIRRIANEYSTCIAITGAHDTVVDGSRAVITKTGAPIMTQITAMGCALTAVMAAMAAVEENRVAAATAALLWFNIAGEIAADKSDGPGTFVPHFLDELSLMNDETIRQRADLK